MKISNRRSLLITACLLFVLLLAGGAYNLFFSSKEKGRHPLMDGVTVEAALVDHGTLTRRIKAVGVLKAMDYVVIKPEISGRIAKIYFHDGASVKAGDPLIQLDDVLTKAQLQQAEAKLEYAKVMHERATELHKRDFGTTSNKDKSLAELRTAEAEVEVARAHLEKTLLRAPFDGTVGLKEISVGGYANVGQDLLTLVSTGPLNIDFRVPEMYLQNLSLGQQAEIRVDGFNDTFFKAVIAAIDPKADPNGHSIQIRSSLTSESSALRPGLFAEVMLIIGEQNDALLIPEAALDRSGNDEYVYRIVQGVAVKTIVITGTRENGKVEIRDGLRAGDLVITAGQIKIRDGVPVQIVNGPPGSQTS